MADRAHSTSRRALLAGLTVSTTLGVSNARAVVSEHPDAAILAHEPALRALQAEIDRLSVEVHRLSDLCEAETAPRLERGDPAHEAWGERWRAVLEQSGYNAKQAAYNVAVWRLGEHLDELIAIPARTLEGLCLKARYGVHYEDMAENVIDDLVAIDLRRGTV